MIEDIILQYSRRGMDILQNYLSPDFCRQAAQAICEWERGTVMLTTGFYVAGAAETDGPPGLMVVAKVLLGLGFRVVVVTDIYCEGLFEELGDEADIIYAPIRPAGDFYEHLLAKYDPVGLISIERCGRNENQDYANMRGISIAAETAAIDTLFLLAADRGIPTVGVGDGGNEIGMGVLKEEITEGLSLNPCVVPTDYLVIATVSNWGAYGLCAYLCECDAKVKMPKLSWLKKYLADIVAQGAVDGVLGKAVVGVDGFPPEYEYEIYNLTRNACSLCHESIL